MHTVPREALLSGERQVAPTVERIRRDHVERYRWAAGLLTPGQRVLDVGCGIGYGARLLSDHGCAVLAIDSSGEALDYGERHYATGSIDFRRIDLAALNGDLSGHQFDCAVAFEILEHLQQPAPLLRALRETTSRMLVSVPNELVRPFADCQPAFHVRHYTPADLEELLNACGWEVVSWQGQYGELSPVEACALGNTLVVEAKASQDSPASSHFTSQGTAALVEWKAEPQTELSLLRKEHGPVPESVAIVAMGPSASTYLTLAGKFGSAHKVAEEIWVINAQGNVLVHDRLFAMDDLKIQEARAAANPKSHVRAMLAWMREHPRFYTSRAYPDYPGAIAFPLQAVLNAIGPYPYLNNTTAYPLALAIALGVRKIHLYGMDFTYANRVQAEEGRGCIEFLIATALAKGITVQIPTTSNLLGSSVPDARRFYGYDTQDVLVEQLDGQFKVTLTDRPPERIPTAQEMERRYWHGSEPPQKQELR